LFVREDVSGGSPPLQLQSGFWISDPVLLSFLRKSDRDVASCDGIRQMDLVRLVAAIAMLIYTCLLYWCWCPFFFVEVTDADVLMARKVKRRYAPQNLSYILLHQVRMDRNCSNCCTCLEKNGRSSRWHFSSPFVSNSRHFCDFDLTISRLTETYITHIFTSGGCLVS
jgi:hypothetical protein